VSGRRLWGWAQERWGDAESFFAEAFVLNYCPLVFMEASGRNRVPEKLPKEEREALGAVCDSALRDLLELLQPRGVVGVGAYARKCAERIAPDGLPVGQILHPSPASPVANRGWAPQADAQLNALDWF
jgi:single-strand selective monofunctional uracil DNA glycosylase